MVSLAKTSGLLASHGFAHGFFTRRGGVSPAPWDSLNFAANTGDSLENVDKNLEVASAILEVAPWKIYFLSQVHGTDAVEVDGALDRTRVVLQEGDATFSTDPTVACGVRSADCGTILVGDLESGAALAIHSGWQGTVKRIVPHAIARLRERIGGDGRLVAAIGPLIEACCFEVGDDVAVELAGSSPLGDAAV
ncbi:MAG TPA: laccase domain-containing protein, partial [Polyangiaceae bacterium]|nr:laccase domain-containing protein [Polyangiaceae bacterium]